MTTLPGINLYTTTTNEGTKRYKCPVHFGKNRSVAVGFIGGRAWAKCWSHGCSQSDILAALNLSNSQSIPWTPPPPRSRPTISVKPLTPVSPTQASEYLLGTGRHLKALESPINAMMAKVVAIGVTQTSAATRTSLATAGNWTTAGTGSRTPFPGRATSKRITYPIARIAPFPGAQVWHVSDRVRQTWRGWEPFPAWLGC